MHFGLYRCRCQPAYSANSHCNAPSDTAVAWSSNHFAMASMPLPVLRGLHFPVTVRSALPALTLLRSITTVSACPPPHVHLHPNSAGPPPPADTPPLFLGFNEAERVRCQPPHQPRPIRPIMIIGAGLVPRLGQSVGSCPSVEDVCWTRPAAGNSGSDEAPQRFSPYGSRRTLTAGYQSCCQWCTEFVSASAVMQSVV